MATPIFSLSSEILTDAPFEVALARLRQPDSLACLQVLGPWAIEEQGGVLRLTWWRRRLGAEESGTLTLSPHERGAHLCLEARHKGWTAFGSFGVLRWHTDQLLEHLVEEL